MNYKKISFIFLLFIMLLSSISLNAQQKYFMRQRTFDKNIKIGIKAGANFAKTAYSDDRMADYDHLYKARPMFGASVEIPLTKVLSISPEVLFVGKGAYVEYLNNDNDKEMYRIKSNYIDLRVPILINIPINGMNRFYVMFAPDLGFNIGGNMSINSSDINGGSSQALSINKDNTALIDFGVLGGLGCRFNIPVTNNFYLVTRIELGYNHGLIDSYTNGERSGDVQSLNVNNLDVQGTRINRGIEAAIILSIPLSKGDAYCP
ncbi:PorT family protein [Odoribacter sp. OttesenSCG-928-L07]|nr:PorT family protein [Odoribacter sp. OttesenSCG-928-L07]MDL2239330.1 PorT family protein [Bacteroidales bacterium OttesenSCG-928-L14]MDL2240375.1 PorT family protein [Bacteroidales bacterium OttesenSCG-928-K22]